MSSETTATDSGASVGAKDVTSEAIATEGNGVSRSDLSTGQQIKSIWKEFGSMINTGLLCAAVVAGIWKGGGWAEATTSAIAKNASTIERLERDQASKWISHEQYHKERIVETKDVQKETATMTAALRADVISISRKVDTLEYRQSQTEQSVGSITASMKDIQGLVSGQSGDIKLLLQLVQRQENERLRK